MSPNGWEMEKRVIHRDTNDSGIDPRATQSHLTPGRYRDANYCCSFCDVSGKKAWQQYPARISAVVPSLPINSHREKRFSSVERKRMREKEIENARCRVEECRNHPRVDSTSTLRVRAFVLRITFFQTIFLICTKCLLKPSRTPTCT